MAKDVLSVRLEPLHSRLVKNVRLNLLLLWGAVGFVLLIACANFANLLLARAATRRKELAVRAALGAGRRRLVRQLLTESAILSLLGGAIGLLLAHWGARALLAISSEQMPRINEIRINGWVVGFTLSLSLLTGVVFGLIPALSSSRIDLTGSLKDGASVTTTGFRLLRHHRARSLLVVSEIMLALVLLAGAGLLIKSFLRLLDVEKGFTPENVLTLLVELPEIKYPEAHQTNAFWQRLIEGIEKLPGVQTVAMTSSLPLTKRGALTSIQIANRAPESLPVADDSQAGGLPAPPGGGFGASAVYSAISPDYFRAMGIALRRGRQFTEQDVEKKPMVVIISEAMARRYWPGKDAVGQRIKPGFSDSSWFTVVGVVSNVRHFRLEAEARPEMYFPYLQISDENAAHSMSVVIRATVPPATLANAVRKQVWDLDTDQPITELATMEEKLATVMTTRRFNLLTLGAFAALAMALVALGIYGVMAYHATQRTHEIGVRIALGARPRDVLTLALARGMKLTLAGVALGLVSAFALTRSMKSLLFDISATDPLTFVSVTLLLIIVALIASYIPARRAMKVDPLQALRHD
jgi:putative ABC transport system permease protein